MKALLALALLAVSSSAAGDGFAMWFPQFQAAVAKNNPRAVAGFMQFPLDWELGSVRKVASLEDFAQHFPTYFPVDMRRAVANAKPVAIPGGYMVTWKARGDEYSLYFKKQSGHFLLVALSEGPQ